MWKKKNRFKIFATHWSYHFVHDLLSAHLWVWYCGPWLQIICRPTSSWDPRHWPAVSKTLDSTDLFM